MFFLKAIVIKFSWYLVTFNNKVMNQKSKYMDFVDRFNNKVISRSEEIWSY